MANSFINNDEHILAIDLGGSYTKIALMRDEQILEQKVFPTPQIPEDFIKLIKLEIFEFNKNIKLVSVAAAGIWDEKMILRQSFNLTKFIGYEIWSKIEQDTKTKVILNTDLEMAVLGEAVYGYNDQLENLLYINFGTGYSAGLYKDGKVFSTSYSPCLRLDMMIQPQRAYLKNSKEDGLQEIEYESDDLITSNIINLAVMFSPQVIALGGGKVKEKWSERFKPCINNAMNYLNQNLNYQIKIEAAKLDYPSLWGAYQIAQEKQKTLN